MTSIKLSQSIKQASPNEVTDEGKAILFKDLQHAKQEYPIEVTDEGIEIFFKDAHQKKQLSLNEVTDGGMVILLKEEHNLKQFSPNEVTVEGIVMLAKDSQPLKALSPKDVTVYSTSSLAFTFSGTLIMPEYFSLLLGITVADLLVVSNKYLNPLIVSILASPNEYLVATIIIIAIRMRLLSETCVSFDIILLILIIYYVLG